MRPWTYAGPNPDGWWCRPPDCVQAPDPSVTVDAELGLAKRLNVVDVRIEFPWALIEPQRGVYDWSRADLIVDHATADGVILQPVVVWSPSWESPDPRVVTLSTDFAAFLTAFVTRYAGRFPVIEMWNEPDVGHYWTSGEGAYIKRVLNPGYAAVKAVDASVQVEMGAPANDAGACCTWLSGLIDASAHFDIAAFHDYAGNATVVAADYRRALDASGRSSTPVWLGEYGVNPGSATTDDADQVTLMRQVLQSSAPIAMAQWYNLRDDFALGCCPPKVVKPAYWGLVDHDDCTLKTGFVEMASLLGGDASPPCAPPTSTAAATASASAPSVAVTPRGPPPPGPGPPIVSLAVGAIALLGLSGLAFLRIRETTRRRHEQD